MSSFLVSCFLFVIRDLKIIEGAKGSFVAMPSRKLTDRCQQCGCKNHLRARYCNQCGHKLDEDRATRDADGRAKLHADIAHPINSACREVVQSAIIKAYQEEREQAKQPGYVSSYDELEGEGGDSYSSLIGELNTSKRGPGDGYRAHGAHPPRGTHSMRQSSDHEAPAPVAARQEDPPGDFGAGIL